MSASLSERLAELRADDLAATIGRRFAARPPKPQGVRVVRDLPGGRVREISRARLVYAGERDGVHYWSPVTAAWIDKGDRIEVGYLPPDTAISGFEVAV